MKLLYTDLFNMFKNTKGFTLVELIVVVTILAILSTIGFVSYSGYLAGVRDTNRIAQLKAIGDALHLYSTNKSLPTPDNKIDITTNGTNIIGYQGYVGKDVINTVGYTSEGLDPKDKTYFSYYLTKSKKYFQLMAFLEEEQGLTSKIKLNNQIQAEIDYETRYPRVEGSKLGILTGTGGVPIQEVLTIVNLSNGTGMTSYLSNSEILTGASLTGISALGSCKRLYEIGGKRISGIYTIDPHGNGIGYEVYCDMKYRMTDLLMGEGNFSLGNGISTEVGSNPTNSIVKINSPIDSGYAVHQTLSRTSEYEIHLPDVTRCKAGDVFRMSGWVADTDGSIFHHRFFDTTPIVFYIGGNSMNPGITLKEEVIDGKIWKLNEVKGILTDDLTDLNWYVGYNAEDPKDLYFTGLKMSCLPN